MHQVRDTGAGCGAAGLAEQETFPWRPDSAKRRNSRAVAEKKTISEIALHETVAQFLDWCLAPPAFYTTFPAGWGKLTKATAGKLNACGLKAGMPDLLLFWQGQTIGIELKVKNGRVTVDQLRVIEKLGAAGVPVHVCYSVQAVEDVLRDRSWPLRGTLKAWVR